MNTAITLLFVIGFGKTENQWIQHKNTNFFYSRQKMF